MLSNPSLAGRELLMHHPLLLDLRRDLGRSIAGIVVVPRVSKTSDLVLCLSIKTGTLGFVIKSEQSNVRGVQIKFSRSQV